MWTVPYNNNILNSKHYKLFTWWFLKVSLFCFPRFSHIGSSAAVSNVKPNPSECDGFPADGRLELLYWE